MLKLLNLFDISSKQLVKYLLVIATDSITWIVDETIYTPKIPYSNESPPSHKEVAVGCNLVVFMIVFYLMTDIDTTST